MDNKAWILVCVCVCVCVLNKRQEDGHIHSVMPTSCLMFMSTQSYSNNSKIYAMLWLFN